MKQIQVAKENNPVLGKIKGLGHEIQLSNSSSIAEKPYRIPMILEKKLNDKIKRLLELDVIRKNNLTFAVPAFIVFKKSGEVRLVVDYCKLNRNTIKKAWLLPNIQDYLLDLKGYSIYFQLNMNSGYHQILIKETNIFKTGLCYQVDNMIIHVYHSDLLMRHEALKELCRLYFRNLHLSKCFRRLISL